MSERFAVQGSGFGVVAARVSAWKCRRLTPAATREPGTVNRRARRAGLTLVEVMMALAILGIGLSALIQTASRCLAVISQSKSYETSRNLLNRVELEDPIALKEEVQEGTDGGSFDSPYSNYRWERDIKIVGNEDDGLFEVTTRVYWSQRGNELYDEVVTYIYAPEAVEGGTVSSR